MTDSDTVGQMILSRGGIVGYIDGEYEEDFCSCSDESCRGHPVHIEWSDGEEGWICSSAMEWSATNNCWQML